MPGSMGLGRSIGYCGHLGKLYLDMRLRRENYNVTPVQSHALLYLAGRDDGQEVTQRDLERELRLKPSTVNGIVDRLVEKDYVTRRASPTDGRCRLVELTEPGRAAVTAFRSALEEAERMFRSELSQEEQATLLELLQRIITNLENEVNHS